MHRLENSIPGVLVKEIWKKVSGFPDYKISSFGRLMSRRKRGRPSKTGKEKLSYTLLRTGSDVDPKTYLKVKLHNDTGQTRQTCLHILVAEAFMPEGKSIETPIVDHKDSNRHNNRVDNLEWVSWSENSRRAHKSGTRKRVDQTLRVPSSTSGEEKRKAKADRVKRIIKDLESGRMTAENIAVKHKVSKSYVYKIAGSHGVSQASGRLTKRKASAVKSLLLSNTLSLPEIAHQFGVNVLAITEILRGNTYSDAEPFISKDNVAHILTSQKTLRAKATRDASPSEGTWKPIPIKGLREFYDIDENGVVLSHHGSKTSVLKPHKNGGYPGYQLMRNGKLKWYRAAKLVARTHVKGRSRKKGKVFIKHADGDLCNVLASNLKWVVENKRTKPQKKKRKLRSDAQHSILSEKDVIHIRELVNVDGKTCVDVAETFKVNAMTIADIAKGKLHGEAGGPIVTSLKKGGRSSLGEAAVREALLLYAKNKWDVHDFADHLGIKAATAYPILSGRTWKHLERPHLQRNTQ